MYSTCVKKHCKRNSRMHDASWQSWTFPPVLFADRSSIKVSSCFSKRDSLSLSKFRSFSISWSQVADLCNEIQQQAINLKQPSTAMCTKQSKLNGSNDRHDHPLIGPPSACAAHPEGHWGWSGHQKLWLTWLGTMSSLSTTILWSVSNCMPSTFDCILERLPGLDCWYWKQSYWSKTLQPIINSH